jgi:nitroreductase
MNTEECIKTRRSVRKYKDKQVDWDTITHILDAGKFAPSAGNIQNWKFVVVRSEAVIKKLAQASFDQDWMEDAPVHIIVVGEPEKASRFYGARGERLYTIQSCAAAVENMLLVANELGLGSCWVGAFDESKVKRALNMPEGVTPQAIITIGYAAEKPELPARIELEHQVYMDKWWSKGQGYKAKGYRSVAIEDAIRGTKKALKRAVKKIKKK